jgi:hypothetical protein
MRLDIKERVKSLFELIPRRFTSRDDTLEQSEAPSPYEGALNDAYAKLQELRAKCKEFQNYVYAEEVADPRMDFLDGDELSEVKRSARKLSEQVVAQALPGGERTYGAVLGKYTSKLMDIKRDALLADVFSAEARQLNTKERIMHFQREVEGLTERIEAEMENYDAQAAFNPQGMDF